MPASDSSNLKTGWFKMEPGKPIRLSDEELPRFDGPLTIDSSGNEDVLRIGKVFQEYTREIRRLVNGPFKHILDQLPDHLTKPTSTILLLCSDGLIVRRDLSADGRYLVGGSKVEQSISIATTLISENAVMVISDSPPPIVADETMQLVLSTHDGGTGTLKNTVSMHFRADVALREPSELPRPPRKPHCLASLGSEITLALEGHEHSPDSTPLEIRTGKAKPGRPFIYLMKSRLPVGWEWLEIYAFFDLEDWKVEYAPLWAEKDLYAFIMARQSEKNEINNIDPTLTARLEFQQLFRGFRSLLDSDPEREEILQVFLKEHPQLLCPTSARVWPKLALGRYVTDFVFREISGDYLLVELERSTPRLFNQDGHLSSGLSHAIGQTVDWQRYLEDNLQTVQRELGLEGISTNPSKLVVMGRSRDLTPENRRKLTTIENMNSKLKILTYDDVLANAVRVVENYLGPVSMDERNDHVLHLVPRSS